MNANALYKRSSSVSSTKYILNCSEKITENNPTTKDWLNNLKFLKTISRTKSEQMTHKKILEGVLMKKHDVVIKISDTEENLKYEYDIYQKLVEYKVKGILHYICYFECMDNIKNINEKRDGICEGTGNNTRILVMEYIKNKSFGLYAWENSNQIKSCLKQLLCTCLDAFLKCGFIHGDLNCNNILIKNTKSTTVTYIINGKVIIIPLYGFKIKLMDFESSKTGGTIKQFYKDFRYKFASSFTEYIGGEVEFINNQAVKKLYDLFVKYYEECIHNKDSLWVFDLFPIIDKL
uniref:non-specific serine/threonine protein kinase n=1 Tax=viral metagenome TaxID=1070528 RepID=A0A6C0KUV5_9ZZZZ